MTEENLDELEEKETPEDSSQSNPEEETLPEGAEGDSEEDEFTDLSEDELREKARKLKTTADNYKREIETKGLRKKNRTVKSSKPSDTSEFEKDYLSKREDILHEFKSEFDSLDDDSWKKISNLVHPALDGVYKDASKEERYVARGELKKAVSDLVSYAKGQKDHETEVEKARLKGIADEIRNSLL
jgi:hypothetical protein